MEAGEGEPEVGVQIRNVDGHSLVLVKPPEASASRCKWFVFTRQLEHLIFTSGKHSSNLHFDLAQLELSGSVRYMKRAGDHGTSAAQFKAIINAFNRARRAIDPLARNNATHCSIIPIKVAVTLALHRGKRPLLEALGGTVPESWTIADRIAENEARGEVDGRDLLPDEDALDTELGEDELLANCIQSELALDNGTDEVALARQIEQEEQELGHNYALQNPSVALKEQLKAMEAWRTSTLQMNRSKSAVVSVTWHGERSTILRFLGWLNARPGALEAALDLSVFGHDEIESWVMAFSVWCIETRKLQYGSLSRFSASIMPPP